MSPDTNWLEDKLHSAHLAASYVRAVDREQFLASTLHHHAVIRRLTIIGEAAKMSRASSGALTQSYPGNRSRGSVTWPSTDTPR